MNHYPETCRWCKQPFDALVPRTNLCSPVCRALESLFIGAESRKKRDPALVSTEARADALFAAKMEGEWTLPPPGNVRR